MLLLVRSDPIRPRRADEHFAAEATVAGDAGVTVALVDHDALADPGEAGRAVARVPDSGGTAVYRGWMLRASQYAGLARALAARGVTLRTSVGQYRQAHELPGWFHALAPVTPRAEWTEGDAEHEFLLACGRLGSGPAVLRDYVKSMKHYWHEAAYIPDVADSAAAWKVAARFRELRDEEFTGGFVLRRFERFTSTHDIKWSLPRVLARVLWWLTLCDRAPLHPGRPCQAVGGGTGPDGGTGPGNVEHRVNLAI
jgi:hypothetical protein